MLFDKKYRTNQNSCTYDCVSLWGNYFLGSQLKVTIRLHKSGHRYPKFSMTESRAGISTST